MSASDSKISGVLHGRPFLTSVAAALAAILLGLGYLGIKQSPPAAAVAFEKLTIALSALQQESLFPIAAAKGFFAAEGLAVTLVPVPAPVPTGDKRPYRLLLAPDQRRSQAVALLRLVGVAHLPL